MAVVILVLAIAAYLIGSVPTGLVLSRFTSRTDIRSVGSGNIGATNVARLLGKKLGALTFLGDMLKGLLPVWIGAAILQGSAAQGTAAAGVCILGFAAVAGHCFSVYLKFSGGKGVSTASGVFLYLAPAAVPPALIIFIATALCFRYVSLASLVTAGALPLVLLGLSRFTAVPPAIIILSLAVCALIFLRHRANIQRLLQGSESRIGAAK